MSRPVIWYGKRDMWRTCEHVSRQCALWTFFQCARDIRGSVGFFRRGILRLSSIILNSPFECDVIQLNVRSGSRWACLFDVHEHDRLGFGILSVKTAVLNPRAVFDCICIFSSNCDRKGQYYPVEYYLLYFSVFGISGRVLWRKDPAFLLKHYKSMWQYLARNFKTDLNILVLLNLWVYGNWRRHATQFQSSDWHGLCHWNISL